MQLKCKYNVKYLFKTYWHNVLNKIEEKNSLENKFKKFII